MLTIARVIAVAAALAALLSSAHAQATLKAVQARGHVQCGVSQGLPGFSAPNDQGEWAGFDVDFCRALAAAIFDDPGKVAFIPLSAKDRFTALQSGDIDVLARNSTWTLSRDTALGLDFPAITFYDGQGFLVRKSLKVASALELSGASICTQTGTTTELNAADFFHARGMTYEMVTFATNDEAVKAYDTGENGRCDALTTDIAGLYAERLKMANPDDHLVLPEVISKEPLGPVVRHGDSQWADIVRWTHFAMVTAEELGITARTVDTMMKSQSPEVWRVLGVEGNAGEQLGLTKDWVVRIVRKVGNYGEVFDRTVGKDSRLGIPRGANALWTKGGLQYAPPIR